MNQRKDINFDICYKLHYPRFTNNEKSSSEEGDSDLEEEDTLNRPTSLLSHLNDTVEYCTPGPQNSGESAIATKKKKRKKATPEKQPKSTQSTSNRFTCLDTEPDVPDVNDGEEPTNGISNCWNADNHSSVLKLFPGFSESKSVQDLQPGGSGICNGLPGGQEVVGKKNKKKNNVAQADNNVGKLIAKGVVADKSSAKKDPIQNNISSNGSQLVQNTVILSKKSKKKKNAVQVQSLVSNNKSVKENMSKNDQVGSQKTGAIKKNSASQPNVAKKASEKKTVKTKENQAKKAAAKSFGNPFEISNWNPNMASVQSFFDSMMFTNVLPALNPNPQHFPPLPPSHWYSDDGNFPSLEPPSHWYSDDINFPMLEPGKNNIGFENFPPLRNQNLHLDKHNFPPIQPSHFTMPRCTDGDKKLAEIALKAEILGIIKPKKKKKKSKEVVAVCKNIVTKTKQVEADKALKLPILALKPNVSKEVVENKVYQCAIPENVEESHKCAESSMSEEFQNISVASVESNSKNLSAESEASPLNESLESDELNQSFDSVQSKSADSLDSGKFPLDENYVEILAQQFLSGELSLEQIWYVELGQTRQPLHILEESKRKSKKSKKAVAAAVELPESGSKLTSATSNLIFGSLSEDRDVESCTSYEPVLIEKFDDASVDYFTMQRNPEELSVSYVYSSVNQSLISFCDDHISKNHVIPRLDSNTGVITLKSPLSTN